MFWIGLIMFIIGLGMFLLGLLANSKAEDELRSRLLDIKKKETETEEALSNAHKLEEEWKAKTPYVRYEVNDLPVVTLFARIASDWESTNDTAYQEYIKEQLVNELAKGIIPYVMFDYDRNIAERTIVNFANIKVVDRR